MTLKLLKKHMDEHGKEYYEKIVAESKRIIAEAKTKKGGIKND